MEGRTAPIIIGIFPARFSFLERRGARRVSPLQVCRERLRWTDRIHCPPVLLRRRSWGAAVRRDVAGGHSGIDQDRRGVRSRHPLEPIPDHVRRLHIHLPLRRRARVGLVAAAPRPGRAPGSGPRPARRPGPRRPSSVSPAARAATSVSMTVTTMTGRSAPARAATRAAGPAVALDLGRLPFLLLLPLQALLGLSHLLQRQLLPADVVGRRGGAGGRPDRVLGHADLHASAKQLFPGQT
ncbi:hypothetical protein PBRA_007540 [Plasmodiophora brassicae]|uniref:Uncharacterized protein n=1 Tax=Plasmodiophora brassicae TaxID=37360 RepID=A0A0G4IXN1_PLABS|nr:hypothetical protein PBRA_007540 [Plasmodiophora brassicae]